MTNEIKFGDTVRVSKDAQNGFAYILNPVWFAEECKVIKTNSYSAVIILATDKYKINGISIPTKYLVKVGGEEKEPRFKVGDKVIPKLPFAKKILTVLGYDDKMPCLVMIGEGEFINEKYLEPYTEPTDEGIKARTDGSDYLRKALDDTCKPQCGGVIESSLIHLGDTDWDAYTADLAKEIAVELIDMTSVSEEVARKAVQTAKSVVEELKKK